MLIGATDILAGERVVFHGETLTYDDVIASAAVPPLFRAVNADGKLYWDGLFSTNPPVREFTDLPEKPEEVWVVQINPSAGGSNPERCPRSSTAGMNFPATCRSGRSFTLSRNQ